MASSGINVDHIKAHSEEYVDAQLETMSNPPHPRLNHDTLHISCLAELVRLRAEIQWQRYMQYLLAFIVVTQILLTNWDRIGEYLQWLISTWPP